MIAQLWKRRVAIAIVALCACITADAGQQSQAPPPGFGGVSGRVVDKEGNPIANAKVFVESTDSNKINQGRVRFVHTDHEGRFLHRHAPVGIVVVSASKEEDGYPNVLFAALVSDASDLPQVSVTEGQISDGVIVRIEQGGTLLLRVLDSQTKTPVGPAHLRFVRRDDPSLYVSTTTAVDGSLEYVLPALAFDIHIAASDLFEGKIVPVLPEKGCRTELAISLNKKTKP